MINVKISDLLNATEVLQELSKKQLKARLAFDVSRLLKAADTEVTQFNEARMKVINKFGEKDENGELSTDESGNCRIVPANIPDFNNELNELINAEVELNAKKIKMDALEDLDFTPSDMVVLEPFIEVEE